MKFNNIFLEKRLRTKIKTINSLYLSNKGIDLIEITQIKNIFSVEPIFALVKQAIFQEEGLELFDEQLMTGLMLLENRIVEMNTGEGKTLAACLPAAYHALSGSGVHVVTANAYLARRDAELVGRVLSHLGLSVSYISAGQSIDEKRRAYQAHIVYGAAHDFIKDFLNDQKAIRTVDVLQKPFNVAIIDEADSVLIDDAQELYTVSRESCQMIHCSVTLDMMQSLVNGLHYQVDHQLKNTHITDDGFDLLESIFIEHNLIPERTSLYDADYLFLLKAIEYHLYAREFLQENSNYLIEMGRVIVIDEKGRRRPELYFKNGIQQAIQLRENILIGNEREIIFGISSQNYFRRYQKLSGMSGTALSDSEEFWDMYALEVIKINPHRPIVRLDLIDKVFLTEDFKLKAIVQEVKQLHQSLRPVLIGTLTTETADLLSSMLIAEGLRPVILSAKHHQNEADIINLAGKLGAITIVTPMAGRGVDILLGGNPKTDPDWQIKHDQVVALGGLAIIGAARHPLRRIDKQLRGRAGRQGDPGSTQFYISLDDQLLKAFVTPALKNFLGKSPMKNGVSMTFDFVSNAMDKSQKQNENHFFNQRKYIANYEDIIDRQRNIFQADRQKIIASSHLVADMKAIINDINRTNSYFSCNCNEEIIRQDILAIMDNAWVDHVQRLDDLKDEIQWRRYAQNDPKTMYKIEAFKYYQDFHEVIKDKIKDYLVK